MDKPKLTDPVLAAKLAELIDPALKRLEEKKMIDAALERSRRG